MKPNGGGSGGGSGRRAQRHQHQRPLSVDRGTTDTHKGAPALDPSAIAQAVAEALSMPLFVEELAAKVAAKITDAVTERLQESLAIHTKVVEELRADIQMKDEQIASLKEEMLARTDALEQYQRRNSLRIFGVKEEKVESTNQIAIDIVKKIGVSISSSDIDRSHRVGRPKPGAKNPRPIIVKFVSYDKRREVFQAKKLLRKTGIVIQEDLTKARLDLLKKAISIFGLSNVWTYDGTIMTVAGDNKRYRITCIEDLSKLPVPSHGSKKAEEPQTST